MENKRLKELTKALYEIRSGRDFSVSVHFRFQRDPASGRMESETVDCVDIYAGAIEDALEAQILACRREIAAELRRQADKIDVELSEAEKHSEGHPQVYDEGPSRYPKKPISEPGFFDKNSFHERLF